MTDTITSILTDVSSRDEASIKQKLFTGTTTQGAWLNVADDV